MVWYVSTLKRLLTPLTMQFSYENLQFMDLIWVTYDSLFLTSFLVDRSQTCCVNGTVSRASELRCGVPQGSILGPLFFFIYINDLPNCLNTACAKLFADDTNTTVSGPSLADLEQETNSELLKLHCWLKANKLSPNVAKTEFMVIGSRQKLLAESHNEINIKLEDQVISKADHAKSLGLIINNRLSWSNNFNELCRFFLSTQSLRTLYNSMILPYLYYCNLAWGGTYKANLQRIVILQKRALRIVNNSTYDANTSPIFKELKLLKFHDIHSFQLGFFMFSLKNSTLPSKFNNLFLINSQIHNYNTRNAHSFRLPLCRTNTRQFSIYFQGPKFYNSLNSTITGSSSSASFKRKLKEFLLSTYQLQYGTKQIIRLINLTCVCIYVCVCVCVSPRSKLAIISQYCNYIIKTSLS